jgi:DNA-binding NarL/FixJ family response regulator
MDGIDTLLVARDRLFREGFARLVGTGFPVTGAANLDQALGEIEHGLRPRLLVVEAASIDWAILQRVRSEVPTVKTVVLMPPDQPMPFAVPAECDIDGFIQTEVSPETLKLSLGLVMAGQVVMPSGFASSMFRERDAEAPVDERRALTPRESEVLRSLARGYSNKEIARELDVSAATVKVHLKTLLRKLQVRNRTEAAVWAANRPARPVAALRLGADTNREN